jgi:hypothetical protein
MITACFVFLGDGPKIISKNMPIFKYYYGKPCEMVAIPNSTRVSRFIMIMLLFWIGLSAIADGHVGHRSSIDTRPERHRQRTSDSFLNIQKFIKKKNYRIIYRVQYAMGCDTSVYAIPYVRNRNWSDTVNAKACGYP